MSESFLDGKVTLLRGDCLELLPTLAENSIDSCVTDPPYHLTSIVKRFGAENAAPAKVGKTGTYARASKGFMGKQWDGGDIAFRPELWAEVFRVLKPGAHLLAFSGTRTYHRMACAIEDAGFEIRDQIGWCYGSGFPKSHDVAKSIDKAARGVPHGGSDPTSPNHGKFRTQGTEGKRSAVDAGQGFGAGPGQFMREHGERSDDRILVAEAQEWQGWGTALKPAWEPIVLARKPLSDSSIAANVLKHGTGAINIDGCRVVCEQTEILSQSEDFSAVTNSHDGYQRPGRSMFTHKPANRGGPKQPLGRWPANLIHDGSEEVVRGFPDTGQSGVAVQRNGGGQRIWNSANNLGEREDAGFADGGSAARFFYTAKADTDDRLGSKHPTVKPIDLIRYLTRLVTPKGGTILDPFAGTGTAGEASFYEGFQAVLIEREPEYQADIVKRMGLCLAGPDERRAASIKQIGLEDTPLFGGVA